ncbi:MAG: hypothetical protein EBT07_19005, partial [Actinobacteria bacterium]|nr:hypothetical protein [Actinomycetota bacterium]
VNDAAEDAFLNSWAGEGYWVGLTDRNGEGNWQWSSGEPVTYTNWLNSEPNNNGGRQNYAWYWWGMGGKWDDHIQEGRWPWIQVEAIGGIAEICVDPNGDEDGDGLGNGQELTLGTDPYKKDTDADGVNDPVEIADGTNPNHASSYNNLSKGLVAYYPFNGNARDESGNGRHGTASGGSSLVADRFNRPTEAFMFDGQVGSGIQAQNTTDLNLATGGITLSVWARFSDSQYDSTLAAKHNHWTGNGYGMGVFNDRFGWFVNDDPRLLSPRTYQDGRWHHAVGVWDGSEMRLFVDGALVASKAFSYTNFNEAPFTIAHATGDYPPGWFKGNIDQIRLYNRAFSLGEIGQLYQTESGNL